jgi:hypothetical protein
MSIVTLLAAYGTQPLRLDEQPEGTVGYWLGRLSAALDAQAAEAAVYTAYDEGHHPLQFATSKFRETFGSLFSEFADNWCPVVVDSSNERLQVQGFRFGSRGYEGDKAAWDIWQRNNLDADSGLCHREAIKTGTAFVIVDQGDPPRITVESPAEVIVAHAPGDRRLRIAALKRWIDYDRIHHATVYLPEGTYRFRTREPIEVGQEVRWEPDDPEHVPNPFGTVIPVIPMRNNPSMIRGGRSDLAVVIDLQNAVNKIVTDMLVASEYAAFRQRWATGVEIPVDPDTGRPNSEPYLSSISRVWTIPDEAAKFGEFDVTDLGNYVKAVETLIQHLAAQTRTPPHYLTAGLGQWPSGDSLKASEAGLVAKVKRKQIDFGEAWEEAMRLAFLAQGDDDARSGHRCRGHLGGPGKPDRGTARRCAYQDGDARRSDGGALAALGSDAARDRALARHGRCAGATQRHCQRRAAAASAGAGAASSSQINPPNGVSE